jgi:hypothetical protein
VTASLTLRNSNCRAVGALIPESLRSGSNSGCFGTPTSLAMLARCRPGALQARGARFACASGHESRQGRFTRSSFKVARSRFPVLVQVPGFGFAAHAVPCAPAGIIRSRGIGILATLRSMGAAPAWLEWRRDRAKPNELLGTSHATRGQNVNVSRSMRPLDIILSF